MSSCLTDYETYCEIMNDLIQPINEEGLDKETLKRLYESKLVYLENLRIKCFMEMNSNSQTYFSSRDFDIIYKALLRTREHIHTLIVVAVSNSLESRCLSLS